MPRAARKSKPAFPQAPVTETIAHEFATGLTDRELFASFSLAGIRASGVEFDSRMAAARAVNDADCLIAELAKGGAK